MQNIIHQNNHPKLVPIAAVLDRLGVRATATIYRLIAREGFPRPVKIGTRSVWSLDEIDAWLAAQMARRDSAA